MKTALLTAVLLTTLVPQARAQQSTALPAKAVVAYVSGQRLTNESADGKAGQARVASMMQEKANELRTRQQALEATRKQLTQTPEGPARVDLQQRELQQRTDLERATAQAQVDVQNLQRQIGVEIQPRVRAVLEELVKGTDIQVVVQLETAIVWAAPGLDLTQAVLERLNARAGAAAPAPGGAAR